MKTFSNLPPLVIAAIAIGSLLVVGILIFVLRGQRSTLSRRLDQLESDRQRLMTEALREVGDAPVARRERLGDLKDIFDRFKVVSTEQFAKTELAMLRAGFRSRDAVAMFVAIKIGSTIFGLILALIWVYGFDGVSSGAMMRLAVVIAGALVGTYAPDIYISNIANKRRAVMRRALPDALDLLVIGAEAGMSLDQSLDRVARELMNSWPVLAEELALLRIEMTFLPDRRDALRNFSQRVDLPQARGVITTMLQSDKYGTSLADSLRVLSSEFRKERLLRAEEKAARLPAIMTVPLILFILPTLMMVLMGPAIIMVRKAF